MYSKSNENIKNDFLIGLTDEEVFRWGYVSDFI